MRLRPLISLELAFCVLIATACHRQPAAVDAPAEELSGEPERFSATIFIAVDDGVEREVSVTRIFKSGDLRREEWIEQHESRALIWRPDLGKTYLLDIERRCYVESDTAPSNGSHNAVKAWSESTASDDRSPEVEPAGRSSASASRGSLAREAVDRVFDRAPSPLRVETRRLADQTIDGHPCTVFERREIFTGNQVEVTTTFRARDLNGLAIRIETGLDARTEGSKLITRLRDISREVLADAFAVPPDFRRVNRLPR